MSTDLTTIFGDGWDDAAAEANQRVMRGALLKFSDCKWYGKNGEAFEKRSLIATGTRAAYVRWQGGKPVEWRLQEPGRRLPEREELGDNDASKWEAGPDGKTPRDPWQSTRYVYLIDPKTAEAYTFSTSSWGGREAVATLGDAIARMRTAQANAVPVVELEAAAMQTKFGRKSKPIFKITGWKVLGDDVTQMRALTAAEATGDVVPY